MMSLDQIDSETAAMRCKRPTMSVKEATSLLPMALSTVYKDCESGDIQAVKVGGRWVIHRRELEKLFSLKPTCPCCHV